MCGRFTLRSPARINFGGVCSTDIPGLIPRYNIAPSQNVLAITRRGTNEDAGFLQWGLIPSWSKEPKGFINARAETLGEKPSFTESFQSRRCLILADGFFEWDKKSGRFKQPYFFQLKDEAPFAFAGIWDQWQGDGVLITSCAIITTTPNEMLASIHDRQPAILRDEAQDSWLRSDARPAELRLLLAPIPASEMKSHPVSSDVNQPKIDNEDLVKPVEPSLTTQFRLF